MWLWSHILVSLTHLAAHLCTPLVSPAVPGVALESFVPGCVSVLEWHYNLLVWSIYNAVLEPIFLVEKCLEKISGFSWSVLHSFSEHHQHMPYHFVVNGTSESLGVRS